jgi:flagellar biosynthesis GTPase FlhF
VRASSLQAALQRVKQRYGADARVVESRTVDVREDGSLGRRRLVEIVVDTAGDGHEAGSPPAAHGARARELARVMSREVERIERLVETLDARHGRRQALASDLRDYPLARELLESGASPEAVRRLALSYRSALAGKAPSRADAVQHLRRHVAPASGGWRSFGGCHVFLGDSGAGKTDLVLGTAARLHAAGRQTLVLSLLPRHGGEVRRLQLEAAEQGYDAAIIRRPQQLVTCADRISRYDVVLVDTPCLFGPELAGAGDLQRHLSQNESFHRHCVVPLDLDLREGGGLWEAARRWNCDWLSLTRLDRCRRPGKILDLLGRVALPLSLCGRGPWPRAAAEIAAGRTLTELLVGASPPVAVAAAGA